MWDVTQDAYNIIKEFEDQPGFLSGRCTQLRAYLCPADIWTIGWGHTFGVYKGMEITSAQADALLIQDVAHVASGLSGMVPPSVVLDQHQKDSLVSLCYNLSGGPWALPRLCPKLWQDLLKGEIPEAADEFLDCDHALVDGKLEELPGLKARREAEVKLFLEPTE